MRVVRFAGENVSPSDDGRLYDQIFQNGLFEATTIAPAGGSQINIGPLYGIIRGREFTAEAQTIDAILPTGTGTATGTIYAEIDISKDEPLSVKTALDPWTATNENINVSGVLAQIKIGTYTANPTAVTAASYVSTATPAPAKRLGALENNVSQIGTQLNSVQTKANKNETDIASLSSRVTTAEGKITTAQGNISTLQSKVSTLEGKSILALNYKKADMNTHTTLRYFSAGGYNIVFMFGTVSNSPITSALFFTPSGIQIFTVGGPNITVSGNSQGASITFPQQYAQVVLLSPQGFDILVD